MMKKMGIQRRISVALCVLSIMIAYQPLEAAWYDEMSKKVSEYYDTISSYKYFAPIAALLTALGVGTWYKYRLPTIVNRYVNLKTWAAVCEKKLPYLASKSTDPYVKDFKKDAKKPLRYDKKNNVLTEEHINETIKKCMHTTYQNTIIQNKNNWVNGKISSPVTNKIFALDAYAQKIVVDQTTPVFFHGDIHSDVHSLTKYLLQLQQDGYIDENFKIVKPCYLVFLGDYIDRGWYGIEVLYTLMRLKIANPEYCILLRGNHETAYMNRDYGFYDALTTKYPTQIPDYHGFFPPGFSLTITYFYRLLPVVLYVGSKESDASYNFLQCCHGGLEIGYIPQTLLHMVPDTAFEILPRQLMRAEFNTMLTDSASDHPAQIGFLWNDFVISPEEQSTFEGLVRAEGLSERFNKTDTQKALALSSSASHKVVGVIRGHQHEDEQMMKLLIDTTNYNKGAVKLWRTPQDATNELWQDIVITLNVSPDTSYGLLYNFKFDTYAILTAGKKFPEDWKLQVKTIKTNRYINDLD
jgi:Calcineurin-like phosphoesterase